MLSGSLCLRLLREATGRTYTEAGGSLPVVSPPESDGVKYVLGPVGGWPRSFAENPKS